VTSLMESTSARSLQGVPELQCFSLPNSQISVHFQYATITRPYHPAFPICCGRPLQTVHSGQGPACAPRPVLVCLVRQALIFFKYLSSPLGLFRGRPNIIFFSKIMIASSLNPKLRPYLNSKLSSQCAVDCKDSLF
jgi:hypothetical protein